MISSSPSNTRSDSLMRWISQNLPSHFHTFFLWKIRRSHHSFNCVSDSILMPYTCIAGFILLALLMIFGWRNCCFFGFMSGSNFRHPMVWSFREDASKTGFALRFTLECFRKVNDKVHELYHYFSSFQSKVPC